MSVVTIKMCDVKDCRIEAADHLNTMLSYHQENDNGPEIYTETDVDLCGEHYYEYKTSLPEMHVERKVTKS